MPLNIAFFFLFLAWLNPLHIPPWISWHSELPIFVGVLLLTVTQLYGLSRSTCVHRIALPNSVWIFIALGLVVALQLISGQITFAGDAIVIALYIGLCIICLTVGFNFRTRLKDEYHFNRLEELRRLLVGLAAVIVLTSLASSVVAFAQAFELWENSSLISRMPGLGTTGGNVGQPNHVATLLVMGISSLYFLYASKKLHIISTTLLYLVLVAALISTSSRTGILSFIVLLIWWLAKSKALSFNNRAVTSLYACCLFLVLLWSWPHILAFVLQSSDSLISLSTKGNSRLLVWQHLLEAAAQKPWLGWGLGEVTKALNNVVYQHTVSESFSYGHNILIDLAIGIGLPAVFVLAILVGVWLLRRIKLTRTLECWYCLSVFFPFAVHSMLEFPFAYAYFLMPVMLALGVMEALIDVKTHISIRCRYALIPVILLSIITAWTTLEYVAIEEDFRIARFEVLNISKTPKEYTRPRIILLTQLGALLEVYRIVPTSGMHAEEIELVQRTALRYSWAAILDRCALSLALNGNSEEAVRQLRVLRALHGEQTYIAIKQDWQKLAIDKYPQLLSIRFP
jgi:O-antigen ligase